MLPQCEEIKKRRPEVMRGLDTPVKQIRRKIFTKVAKLGFHSTDETYMKL